jgi:hypothetical protein
MVRELAARVPAEVRAELTAAVEVLAEHAPIVAAALRSFAGAAMAPSRP